MQVRVAFEPKRLAYAFAAITSLLVVASIAGQVSKFFLGHVYLWGLVPLFDVNEEQSLPTWYAVMTLAASAALLFITGAVERQRGSKFARHWSALGLIFVFLSVDEGASMHEKIMFPLRDLLHATGYLYYAWVIPAAAFVLVVGLSYLRFVFALPLRTRLAFIIGGATFVGGAMGLEVFEAKHHLEQGLDFSYKMLCTVEETLEMTGIAIFNVALVAYLKGLGASMTLHFGGAAAPTGEG